MRNEAPPRKMDPSSHSPHKLRFTGKQLACVVQGFQCRIRDHCRADQSTRAQNALALTEVFSKVCKSQILEQLIRQDHIYAADYLGELLRGPGKQFHVRKAMTLNSLTCRRSHR